MEQFRSAMNESQISQTYAKDFLFNKFIANKKKKMDREI